MATGFENWADWGITGGSPYEYKSEWRENLPDIAAYRTPEEDWKRFYSQTQPFWSTRAPMADVGQNLMARYLLAGPNIREPGGGLPLRPDVEPTFGQFLQDYPEEAGGYQAQGMEALRARAGDARTAAETARAPYLADATPGTADFRRRAWLADQFGAGAEGSSSNQQSVANLLALQREGGGDPWRGQMATSIRNAMANLYQQRLNVGAPRESFLGWYLDQTQQ